jgi:single-strand DNA-binding protein
VNVVSLIGTLATDPELRVLGDKRRQCSFRLAVVRPCGAGAAVLRVVAKDRQADQCARLLKQGNRVAVDGSLRSRIWDEDGKRRSAVEVVAHSVTILSSIASEAA